MYFHSTSICTRKDAFDYPWMYCIIVYLLYINNENFSMKNPKEGDVYYICVLTFVFSIFIPVLLIIISVFGKLCLSVNTEIRYS